MLYNTYAWLGTSRGVFTRVYIASVAPCFNGFVFTAVCLSYGLFALPAFVAVLSLVRYSPSSSDISALTAVINFVKAKSTCSKTILS